MITTTCKDVCGKYSNDEGGFSGVADQIADAGRLIFINTDIYFHWYLFIPILMPFSPLLSQLLLLLIFNFFCSLHFQFFYFFFYFFTFSHFISVFRFAWALVSYRPCDESVKAREKPVHLFSVYWTGERSFLYQSQFYWILFCSILFSIFYYILFHIFLFYSVLTHSIQFYSPLL